MLNLEKVKEELNKWNFSYKNNVAGNLWVKENIKELEKLNYYKK